MFGSRPVLPGPSGPSKGLVFLLILVLLGSVVLGLVLGNSELLAPKKKGIETSQRVLEEQKTRKIEISLERLLLLLLGAFIFGLVVGVVLMIPRYY